MIIINGKKHYAEEIRNAKLLAFNGWDRYNCFSNAWQWYYVQWNRATNLVIFEAASSNAPFGENYVEYFNSPAEFAEWVAEQRCEWRSLDKLFGDVDEDDAVAVAFVDVALAG